MTRILILTIIFLIGAVIGAYWLKEERPLYYALYLIGGVFWYLLTYSWWATILLDKIFRK